LVVRRSSPSDAERFAAFAAGEARKEAGLPGWLPDLLFYEAARHVVERAPIPTWRAELSEAPMDAARVALGPAARVLALEWNIPALLPELRRGENPQALPQPLFLLLARTPERGEFRERTINRPTWDLLRRCDGVTTVDVSIAAIAGELGLDAAELAPFADECRRTLATLVEVGLLGW
jgi:hypothetical protein